MLLVLGLGWILHHLLLLPILLQLLVMRLLLVWGLLLLMLRAVLLHLLLLHLHLLLLHHLHALLLQLHLLLLRCQLLLPLLLLAWPLLGVDRVLGGRPARSGRGGRPLLARWHHRPPTPRGGRSRGRGRRLPRLPHRLLVGGGRCLSW